MKKSMLSALLIAAGVATLSLTPDVQADPPEKQLICHKAGKKYNQIEVADQAADRGHRDHGDFPPQQYFADSDGDGFGAGTATEACVAPEGYVAVGGDCDASNAAVNPGAEETCGDSVDNDCDGEADEGCTTDPPASHQVDVLLHCDPNSSVLASYGPGTHTLPWEVQRNVSYIRFQGGTTGKVTLHHCDGRTMELTTNTNLCSLEGGCCSAGRWNDEVCQLTVE